MSVGYPYPIVPPLPDYEQKKEDEKNVDQTAGTSGGGSTITLTPEQLAAQASQDTLLADQTKTAGAETDVNKQKADIASGLATQQLVDSQKHEDERQAAMRVTQDAIDKSRQRIADQQAKLDATPTPKFFHDGDTWGNVLRGVGAGLAGVGDAAIRSGAIRAGAGVPNIDTVGEIIDRDLNRQRENITRLKDSVLTARTGLTDANEARLQMMQDVDLRAAAAYDRTAKLAAARLASLGRTTAEIDGDKNVEALRAKREEARQKALEPLRQQIDSHWNKETKVEKKSDLTTTNRDDTKARALAEKEGSTVVRDENGTPIGHVPSGRGGAQAFATRDADFARALEQLQAFRDDVDKNGDRVYLPEAVTRRKALKDNADIAVATVSPLGATDEAMKKEAGSIGAGGAWTAMGANRPAIDAKIAELKKQRERYRAETLIPIDDTARPTQPPPFTPALAPAPVAPTGATPSPRAADDALKPMPAGAPPAAPDPAAVRSAAQQWLRDQAKLPPERKAPVADRRAAIRLSNAPPPASGGTSVKMPDGSIARFDAAGKRLP